MRIFVIMLVVACGFFLQSCTACSTTWKHLESSVVGLEREVILYDASGKEIRRWSGDLLIENHGGSASFVLNGKTTIVSGTFVIQEK